METDADLSIEVSLKGAAARQAKIDVFVSDCFVKVNAPQSLLQIDLLGNVDDQNSSVNFKENSVLLRLPKSEASAGLWGQLLHFGKDKAALASRREKSVARQQAATEERRKARLTQKDLNGRLATHHQIDLENKQRNLIEGRKAGEKQAAEDDVYEALTNLDTAAAVTEDDPIEELSTAGSAAMRMLGGASAGGSSGEGAQIWSTETVAQRAAAPKDRHQVHKVLPKVLTEEPAAPKAPMRKAGGPVRITFTKPEKPAHLQHLPARTAPEDMPRQERPQAHRDADTVDMGEQNALFLKDRGDAFYGKNDYEAAVNAYSAALTLDRAVAAIYSNRAACFYCLGEHSRCIEDCSAALKLLDARLKGMMEHYDHSLPDGGDPAMHKEMMTTRRSRLRALARRASAQAAAENPEAAVKDYKDALVMDPENKDLLADLAEVEGSVVTRALADMKGAADTAFQRGEYVMADALYSEALKLDSARRVETAQGSVLGCLSNRAACHLIRGNDAECVSDCGAALELAVDPTRLASGGAMAQRTLMRLHVRRGTAWARLGEREGAQEEYASAKEAALAAGPAVVTPAEVASLDSDLEAMLAAG